MTKKTGWSEATTNTAQALVGLVSCLNAGHNAWIEVQKNGEQEFPVKRKNPALDDVRNWESAYGAPLKDKNDFFNDTEKELFHNWVWVYGEPDAINAYQKDGTILPGFMNFPQGGVGHAVRREDATAYRRSVLNDGFDYSQMFWQDYWQPKKGIPYYVTDARVSDVFVICYNDEPYDMADNLLACADFLKHYAQQLQEKDFDYDEQERD